jgi:hypothetical protein
MNELIENGFKYGLISLYDETKYYVINFMNGGYVLESHIKLKKEFYDVLKMNLDTLSSINLLTFLNNFVHNTNNVKKLLLLSLALGVTDNLVIGELYYINPINLNKCFIFNIRYEIDDSFVIKNKKNITILINQIVPILQFSKEIPIRLYTNKIKEDKDISKYINNLYEEPIFNVATCDEKNKNWRKNISPSLEFIDYYHCTDTKQDEYNFRIVEVPIGINFYHGSYELSKTNNWDGVLKDNSFLASYKTALAYVNNDKNKVYKFITIKRIKLFDMGSYNNIIRLLTKEEGYENKICRNINDSKIKFSYLFFVPALNNKPNINSLWSYGHISYRIASKQHLYIWNYIKDYLINFGFDGVIIPRVRTSLALGTAGADEILLFSSHDKVKNITS